MLSETRHRCPFRHSYSIQLTICIVKQLLHIILEFLARAVRPEKETKGIKIEKEEVKLFVDDMTLNIGKSKDSTKKLLELINKSSKVGRYKVNEQKPGAWVHTNRETAEKESRTQTHFQQP